MSLSYRATPTITLSSSSTSATVTKASGTTTGDLILLPVYWSGAATPLPACTGFTADTAVASTSGNAVYSLLSRVSDGSEGSTFTVTFSSAVDSNFRVGQAVIINAVIDAKQTTAEVGGGGNTSCALAGVTVAGSGVWLLWFACGLNASGAGLAPAVPSGITSQAVSSGGGTFQPDARMGDNQSIASGATGTLTGTLSTASFWAGAQIAVKSAVTVVTQNLTTTTVAVAMNAVTPQTTATASLTTAAVAVSAKAVTPTSSPTVALNTAAVSVAMQPLTAGILWNMAAATVSVAMHAVSAIPTPVPIGTSQVNLSMPGVTVARADAFVTLGVAGVTVQAQNITPSTVSPTYLACWYGNLLSPTSSDFQGVSVP